MVEDATSSFAKAVFDLAERQEHRHRLWPRVGLALDCFDADESVPFVERDRAPLCVDRYANAAKVACHAYGQLQHESQKLSANSLTLRCFIDGEASKAKNWKRIARQLPSRRNRQIFDFDVACGNRCEAEKPSFLDRDIRDADVVAELVLSGEQVEEAIEIGVAGLEPESIVGLAERPNLHRA
jgi:hypothetical protein